MSACLQSFPTLFFFCPGFGIGFASVDYRGIFRIMRKYWITVVIKVVLTVSMWTHTSIYASLWLLIYKNHKTNLPVIYHRFSSYNDDLYCFFQRVNTTLTSRPFLCQRKPTAAKTLLFLPEDQWRTCFTECVNRTTFLTWWRTPRVSAIITHTVIVQPVLLTTAQQPLIYLANFFFYLLH